MGYTAMKLLFPILENQPPIILATASLLMAVVVIILPSLLFGHYLVTKFGADLQARVGPNRSGFGNVHPNTPQAFRGVFPGFFQGTADFIRFIQKGQKKDVLGWQMLLGFVLLSALVMLTVATLPLAPFHQIFLSDLGVLAPMLLMILIALLYLFLGFGGKTVPTFFGSLRAGFQMITGAVPSLICILCLSLVYGGLNWTRVIEAQGFSPVYWTVFSHPLMPLVFLVFLSSGWILSLGTPFSGGATGSEIMRGLESHWDGAYAVLFKIYFQYLSFLWAALSVQLFLGSWRLPLRIEESLEAQVGFLYFLQTTWFLAKTILLWVVLRVVSYVLPSLRSDQITDYCWKVLTPLATLSFIIVLISFGLGYR